MTKLKAQRLTGGEVTSNTNPDVPGVVFVYCKMEDTHVGFCGNTEKEALQDLVEYVLRLRGDEVSARQGYKCARCGRVTELQRHHKKYRSHGGTHTVDNLEALCHTCHAKEHTRRKHA